MKVAEGIYKVEGIRVANVYLVEIDGGLLLVDTGMTRGNAGRICRFVAAMGRDPRELRHVVLTHCDIDHVGSVAALKRLTGAQVAIGELDAPVLAGTEAPHKGGRVMRLLYRVLRFEPVAPDRALRDRDEIGGLLVMHVPGHTAGSIALVRDDGVVFSGDALLSDKHGNVQPPDPRLALDPAQAAASAEAVRARGFTLLLSGHGAPAAG